MKFLTQAIPLLLVVVVVLTDSVSEASDDGSILISPSVYEFPPPGDNDDLLTDTQEDEVEENPNQFSSRMGQAENSSPRGLLSGRPQHQQQQRRHPPSPPGFPGNFEEESAEEYEPESLADKTRGILTYNTKSHYVQKNIPSEHHRGPPIPHLGPPAFDLPKERPHPPPKKGWGWGPPPKKGWGWGPPPSHPHHRHPKVPHYVKYWEQNKAPHGHLPKHHKKQGWKVYSKPSPFAPGYWVNLAERLADGVGLLPEYGKEEHKVGAHKHGKYHFKGITLHNGFFTEVL